jgi:bacillolysin
MVYGNGFASADDVVGHELTHAVTELTADLFYYQQSGALNESFSDIFGEAIDQSSSLGGGLDGSSVRWVLGEDLPPPYATTGIRHMMSPESFGDPARVNDENFYCSTQGWTDDEADSGGVHRNSGVPNKAFALMVDGGTFNGETVTGIGMTKAAKIHYRALTTYLTSGSTFIDAYNALEQSCGDLVGTGGITAANCTQVLKALNAVEMNAPLPCVNAAAVPALCASGTPSFVFQDGFEGDISSWEVVAPAPSAFWEISTGVARSGQGMMWGSNPGVESIQTLTMAEGVLVPAGGRMYFDHLFEFENDFFSYDGGRLSYSLNGGPWIDANTLIDAGRNYNGTLASSNPLGTVGAFVDASYGYTGSRLNLGAFAGQSIRFRFTIASDFAIGSLGWMLDNVGIYSCVGAAQPFTDDPLLPGQSRMKALHVTELRSRINSIRAAAGLPAVVWTNTVTAGATIRAADILEMRTALAAAYTAASMTPPVYTDGLATPTAVRALHVTQLRNAVLGIE